MIQHHRRPVLAARGSGIALELSPASQSCWCFHQLQRESLVDARASELAISAQQSIRSMNQWPTLDSAASHGNKEAEEEKSVLGLGWLFAVVDAATLNRAEPAEITAQALSRLKESATTSRHPLARVIADEHTWVSGLERVHAKPPQSADRGG